MYYSETDTNKFECSIQRITSPLLKFEDVHADEKFFQNINHLREDAYPDINELRQNNKSLFKTFSDYQDCLKGISSFDDRVLLKMIFDNISKLSNIIKFNFSISNVSLQINLEVPYQKTEDINLIKNHITKSYLEDWESYVDNINNVINSPPLENKKKKQIFKLIRDAGNETLSDDTSLKSELSISEDNEEFEIKPNKKKSSNKIKERWLKKAKVRIFKYIIQISNNYLRKKFVPNEVKSLFFKKIDQKFIKQAKIDINKKWNEKCLINLLTNSFSDLDKGTQHNIKSINLLKQTSIDNENSRKFLCFLKRTKIKDLIQKYIGSYSYINDIRKLAEDFDEYGVEEYKNTVECYYDYYRTTPSNRKNKNKI
jgi:hypothetical protein